MMALDEDMVELEQRIETKQTELKTLLGQEKGRLHATDESAVEIRAVEDEIGRLNRELRNLKFPNPRSRR